MPVTIYVSDEDAYPQVEAAVTAWIASRGEEIVYRSDAVRGSLWQAFVARLKEKAQDNLDDGLALAARAAELHGLDTKQAEVDKILAEAFATVMEALKDTEPAVIQHGSLLVVKHGGKVVRRELSPLEVAHLRRNPVLTSQPATILAQLQELSDRPDGNEPTQVEALKAPHHGRRRLGA